MLLIMISKDFSRQDEMSPRDSQTQSFCSPSVKGAVRKGLREWRVVVVGLWVGQGQETWLLTQSGDSHLLCG